MKKWLFIVTTLSVGVGFVSAQHVLLHEFDFSQGGYCLLKVPIDYTRQTNPPVAYFDDIPTLQRMQEELVFADHPTGDPRGRCLHESSLYVCRYGQIKEFFTISTECKLIQDHPKSYVFDGYFPYKDYKLARVINDHFQDLASARAALKTYRTQNPLLFGSAPWENYEGEFYFFAPVQSAAEWPDAIRKYEAYLRTQFPGESMKATGKSYPDRPIAEGKRYLINVQCNKSLYDKFDLFPIAEDGWKYFKLDLTSYWPQ